MPGPVLRLIEWLGRHRRLGWVVAVALVAAGCLWLAIGVGSSLRDWVRDPTGDRRRTIAVPEAEPPPLPEPRVTWGDPEAPPVPPLAPELTTPAIDWQAEAALLQAAALLANRNDLEAAFDLLLTRSANPAAWRELGSAAHAEAVAAVTDQFPVEVRQLRVAWQALDADRQARLFAGDSQALAATLSAALAAEPPPTEAALLPVLPMSLRQTLLHNLMVNARLTTELPAMLLQLTLVQRFQPSRLDQMLLAADDGRGEVIPYGDHLAWYAARLDATALADDVRHLLTEEKLRLLDAEGGRLELYAWYKLVWRQPAIDRILAVGQASGPEDLKRTWEALPTPFQPLWEWALYRRFGAAHGWLPPALFAHSGWLRHADVELNAPLILQALRRHPRWQDNLRACRYERAVVETDETLEALHAAGYAISLKQALHGPLTTEKEVLGRRGYPWAQLAGAVRVRQPVPAALLADQAPPPELPAGDYQRWEDVPPEIAVERMRRLATTLRGRERLQFLRLIDLYALNRGLLLAADEAPPPPPLAPDPVMPAVAEPPP